MECSSTSGKNETSTRAANPACLCENGNPCSTLYRTHTPPSEDYTHPTWGPLCIKSRKQLSRSFNTKIPGRLREFRRWEVSVTPPP